MSSGFVQLDFRRRGVATKLSYGGFHFLFRREVASPLSVFLGSGIDPVSDASNYDDLTGSMASSTGTNWLREALG